MAKPVLKDTVKEKLQQAISKINDLSLSDDFTYGIIRDIEDAIKNYEDFRKVAEYMSGMVESLNSKLEEQEQE